MRLISEMMEAVTACAVEVARAQLDDTKFKEEPTIQYAGALARLDEIRNLADDIERALRTSRHIKDAQDEDGRERT